MERYFRTQDNEFIDTQKHQVKPLAPNEYEWYRIDDKRAVRVFVKNDNLNNLIQPFDVVGYYNVENCEEGLKYASERDEEKEQLIAIYTRQKGRYVLVYDEERGCLL